MNGLDGREIPLPAVTWNWQDLGILGATGVLGILFGMVIRLPAPALTGPMLLSAMVHLSGLVMSEPPPLASQIIQLALGSAMGARFFGVSLAGSARSWCSLLGWRLS